MPERETLSQLIAPEHPTTEADVEMSYRLFLARAPEAQAAIAETAGHPLTSVIVSFLVSDEFRTKLGGSTHAPVVSEIMLATLESDLLDWVRSITTPGVLRDDMPLDRVTVIRTLLDDTGIRQAVAAVGTGHIQAINVLRAALAQIEDWAGTVRASLLFNAAHYRGQVDAGAHLADPARHYVIHGEPLGLTPSPRFDAGTYAELNPDVASSGFNRLVHYELCGRQEGRAHRHWLDDRAMPALAGDTARPTILLVLHDATYTGAPILGWNLARALADTCNVVVVLRRGGAVEPALRDVAAAVIAAPPFEATLDPLQMDRFAERLTATYRPLYAIANSVETRSIAIALRRCGVPIIALVHEFWPGAAPAVRLDFYASCAALVFPAHLVEQSSFHAFREIRLQNRFILPQGPCAVPPFDPSLAHRPFGAPFIGPDTPISLETLLADGKRGSGPFTVIGLGAVEMRKGIDLFIAAATALRAKHPEIAFRFLWIGTWEHALGSQYAALLAEQYARADLDDGLHVFPAVDDLEPVYARADALFLSSRLDPLPNITIDAAVRGIPVVCFKHASGTAELLAANPDTAALVVPHLDTGAAADRIAALASDAGLWMSCSEAMQRLAWRAFDMAAYARALDTIGRDAARKFENAHSDQALIENADAFDASLYFVSEPASSNAKRAIAAYIDQTTHINFASSPVFGAIQRRPKAGFHPFIYGTEAPGFPRDGSRDPLAHYVERGMPEGRWSHPVLRPDMAEPACDSGNHAPVALHGHFHYPDHIADFLTALAANRLRADLFLTTTSDETAEILQAATQRYHAGKVVVEVGPNVGRDIYAFLRVLRTHVHGGYELVGHIHGKRSVHTQDADPDFGNRWREFLWQHLLGPRYRAGDTILDALRQDRRLGIVFPENGYLIGWEKNDDSAAVLARRLGLASPLPGYIEFPAGTMFWARVAALDRLIQADLGEADMPAEPLPIDGTVLHAFERMLPLLCQEAGYRYATSYIPHIRR